MSGWSFFGRTQFAPTGKEETGDQWSPLRDGWMEVVLLSPRKQKAGTPSAPRADMESAPTGWGWGKWGGLGEQWSPLRDGWK